MPEVKIQIKLKETGLLTPAPERAAYRMFIDGIADIDPNAQLFGVKDDSEESDIRMTIETLQRLKRKKSPETVYWHLRKHLEENDVLKLIYDEVDMILQGADNMNGLHIHRLGKLLLEKHPEWESMDIERRVRELYEIGWVAKPRFGYYALQHERIRELRLPITA